MDDILHWLGVLIVASPGILFLLFIVAVIGNLSDGDAWRRK